MRPERNATIVWRLEKKNFDEAWERARADDDFEEMGVLTLMIKGGIHQLNLVGAEIWTRIDGVRDDATIASEMSVLFGWEADETIEAVRAFLEGIAGRGWVTLHGGASPASPTGGERAS